MSLQQFEVTVVFFKMCSAVVVLDKDNYRTGTTGSGPL
eukprot:COSAG02_NODE_35238_length_471_cov_1.185484_1_plen_37_part_01